VTQASVEPLVNADTVRLQQVFWNILKNAVKFTPEGGWVELVSSLDPVHRRVRVRVSDSGIGMAASELPRIFDAFSQGDHALGGSGHRFGGLGLGLAITRMLVEAHGGSIVAESAGPNQGSIFTVELPLAAPIDATAADGPEAAVNGDRFAVPATAPANDGAAAVKPGSRGRILLVEDHAPTRASLGAVLGRRGFQVVVAATVAEALAAARQHDLDLVISDIGLPDGDGYQCMQALQQLRPGLAGIALSGYGMEEDIAKSRQVGFSEHLTKPVNVTALDRAVGKILGPEARAAAKPVSS
jgi:CheY-like chemotaxis protein